MTSLASSLKDLSRLGCRMERDDLQQSSSSLQEFKYTSVGSMNKAFILRYFHGGIQMIDVLDTSGVEGEHRVCRCWLRQWLGKVKIKGRYCRRHQHWCDKHNVAHWRGNGENTCEQCIRLALAGGGEAHCEGPYGDVKKSSSTTSDYGGFGANKSSRNYPIECHVRLKPSRAMKIRECYHSPGSQRKCGFTEQSVCMEFWDSLTKFIAIREEHLRDQCQTVHIRRMVSF